MPNFRSIKKKSLLIIGATIFGGVIAGVVKWLELVIIPSQATGNTLLFKSTIPSESFEKNFNPWQIPECSIDSSLETCVTTICDKVAVKLLPLNKPRLGETTIRPKDYKILEKMMDENFEKGIIAHKAAVARVDNSGLDTSIPKNDAMGQYLVARAFIIERTFIRNCAGAAAKVMVLLSEQAIIKQQQATLETYAAFSGERGEHSVVHVTSNSSGKILCDSWNLKKWNTRVAEPVGICFDEQIYSEQPHECNIYQAQYWNKVNRGSYLIKPPSLDKYSPQEKLFYKKEIRFQNDRFLFLNKKKPKKKKFTDEPVSESNTIGMK